MEQDKKNESLNQPEIIVPLINPTVNADLNSSVNRELDKSNTTLGYNDSTKNEFAHSPKKTHLLYPIIIVLSVVAVFVVAQSLSFLFTASLFESPKSSDTMTEAYTRFFVPLAISLLFTSVVSTFFVSYFFKILSKSKSRLSIGYSILLILFISVSINLFLVGFIALFPSTYRSLAPIGIIYALIIYGPIYYICVYAVLRSVKRKRYKLDFDDPNYSLYELLEATIVFLRRISYVGVAGAVLIPFTATFFT